MDKADWISRRLGFGPDIEGPDINQDEWVATQWRLLQDFQKKGAEDGTLEVMNEIPNKLTPGGRSIESLSHLPKITLDQREAFKYRKRMNDLEQDLRRKKSRGEFVDLRLIWINMQVIPLWWASMVRATQCLTESRELTNRLWMFWMDFFPMGESSSNSPAVPNFQRQLRLSMTGKYSDMLYAVTTHMSMLLYLDNAGSVGPRSVARVNGWSKSSYNENLAREVMELFSITPDSGYTQDDVTNAAFILTGWTLDDFKSMPSFDGNLHEPGVKTVMGKKYGGWSSGNSLKVFLDDLAAHPMTAKHLAFRLCQAFVSDRPDSADIERLKSAYERSGGQLMEVYKALIEVVVSKGPITEKFLSPEIWALQMYRTLGLKQPMSRIPYDGGPNSNDWAGVLQDLGHFWGRAAQPNGWPKTEEGWLSAEYLDRRVRFAGYFGRQHAMNNEELFTFEKAKRISQRFKIPLSEPIPNDGETLNQAFDAYLAGAEIFCAPQFLRS